MTRCHCIPVLSAQALPCRLDGYPRILRYWVSTSPIMGYKVVDLTAHTRLLSKDALLVVLIRTVYIPYSDWTAFTRFNNMFMCCDLICICIRDCISIMQNPYPSPLSPKSYGETMYTSKIAKQTKPRPTRKDVLLITGNTYAYPPQGLDNKR